MRFHRLTVTDIKKTTRDAVVITLKPDDEAAFDFVQGQYLTFRREFDGEELRRCYSVCSGKADGVLQIGIKRVDGGAFSTWANTQLSVGDTVEAMPPMGNFYAECDEDNPHYLAFAVGSGITPVLSILRTALAEQPASRFTLVYGNRNPNTIMFREELEDLKNEHIGRLNVIHILSGESQDIDLFRGRITSKKCEALFANWINVDTITMAYICGPQGMMEEVSSSLQKHGLAKERIRFELFTSDQPGWAKKRAASASNSTDGVSGVVTIGGETRNLTVTPGASLLEAALDNQLDAPFSCRSGICSTCKAKLTAGNVEMAANHALEDYEVDAGYVLTCQSYPVSDKKVVWDYDQAGH